MSERRWHIPEERNRLTPKQIRELFLRQDGKCPRCNQKLETKGHIPIEFIDEHVEPLWRSGTNDLSNRALYCKPCALPKTSSEATERAQAYRVRDKHIGIKRKKSGGFRGWRKMNGDPVWKDKK